MGLGERIRRRAKRAHGETYAIGSADAPAHRPVSNLILILCILGYCLWFVLQPRAAFKGLFATMAWVSVIYAMFRLFAICMSKPEDYGLAELSDDLPIYTVLVPLFHEALKTSEGRYVTIYDAEDRPHPDQLLAALAAFKARPDWAAVQAPLEYYNHRDNWLTRQFTLEYAVLFHVWVPFLVRLGLPFPLGGTSNHMRRARLDAIDGCV